MSDVFKAIKKRVTIEAVQWAGDNEDEVLTFTDFTACLNEDKEMQVTTLEGEMIANVGDYIIKGVKGDFYPCKPDIFKATYDF